MKRQTILAAAAAAALGACAATQQARDVETTGFLGDEYALLRPGGENEALLVYRNPNVDWRAYDAIFLELSFLRSPGDGISSEDATTLLDNFAGFIKEEAGDRYLFTTERGKAGSLMVEVAITDADESEPVLDTISSVLPLGLATSTIKTALTGEPAFVGEASIEARISDAATGELLVAAVDRRVGGKSLDDSTSEWGDVNAALEFWAKQFDFRMCELRQDEGCLPPEG